LYIPQTFHWQAFQALHVEIHVSKGFQLIR